MAQTHTPSLLPRISDGVSFVELRQSFPSQIQAISPVVDRLMHFMAKSRSMDGSETDIEITRWKMRWSTATRRTITSAFT
jgi:serine/threonine-protein kinase RsbW